MRIPVVVRQSNYSSEQWLLHDELFYKYAFDVPVPHFNSNANRAAFRRIPESDLPRADRVENDVLLTWHRPEYHRLDDRSSGWRLLDDVAPAALGVTETSMGVSRYNPHIPDDDGDCRSL